MEYIAPNIRQLDTLLAGKSHISASFLIEGEEPALVEAGAQSSASTVIDALRSVGVGPEDLRWVIVTHVHLDHAGAAGDLLAAFPKAKVVVHEVGARHLVDPSRLVDSASRVYGPLLDTVYGRMTPSDKDRVVAATDGMEFTVGPGHKLRIIHSPGHAKHHLAVLDLPTGALLVGDAVGVLIPEVGILRPATPPPDFNLEQSIKSLGIFRSLNPTQVVLTHYGPVPDPMETLLAAEGLLVQWVDIARMELQQKPEATVQELAHVFEVAFRDVYKEIAPEDLSMFELLNGLESNAAGISRYLTLQQDAHVGGR
ncbi:MAG: MBL fold metallo-hydrolase [Candidatus Dormibacteria bacterium]